MTTYQEIVTHWLLLEWKMLRMDRGRDLNASKWKKVYCPMGELGSVFCHMKLWIVAQCGILNEILVRFLDGADGLKSMNKDNLNVAGHCQTSRIVLE